MVATSPVVIEFGDERGRNVYFPPLDRRMRGRFDAVKLAQFDKDAGELVSQWPEPVAGQQLAIDPASGEVAIVEPIHKNLKVTAKLKQKGLTLAPEREIVNCDVPTALHYAKAAIEAGQAIIVSGTIPQYDAAAVRHDFIVKPPADPQSKLVDAINNQAAAFDRLATALEKALAKR
jgi:hypothetical protein